MDGSQNSEEKMDMSWIDE